jgi:hypothetical protein
MTTTIKTTHRFLANLTESFAKVGWSAALAARLRDEEAQLDRLKDERSAAAKDRWARASGPRVRVEGRHAAVKQGGGRERMATGLLP